MTQKPVVTVTRDVSVGLTARGAQWEHGIPIDFDPEFPKNTWQVNPFAKSSFADTAVVICDAPNDEVLQLLLSKYGVVTQAYSTDISRYIDTLGINIRDLVSRYRQQRLEGITTLSEYVDSLGSISGFSNDYKQYTHTQSGDGNSSTEQTIYFIGTPRNIMLSMWNRYTDSATLLMHVSTAEGNVQVDLVNEVSTLCDRYEVLQSAGCLSCPHRDSCIDSLVGDEVSQDEEHAPTVSKVKRYLKRLNYLVLHSDCVKSGIGGYALDYRDMRLKGAHERAALKVTRRSNMASNRKFYEANCKKCSLEEVCGSGKSFTTDTLGVQSFCKGRVERGFVVTEDNYLNVFGIVLQSILKCIRKFSSNSEASAKSCLDLIHEWVDTPVTMPSHAAYYDRKLDSLRKSGDIIHNQYYVIPRKLLDMAVMLDVKGSFGDQAYFRSFYVGDWLKPASESVNGFTGSFTEASDWVAILPVYHSVNPRHYPLSRHECIDTKLLIGLEMVDYKSRSNKYHSKMARIELVAEFLLLFLTPGTLYWYGPFASSKGWLPIGLPSNNDIYSRSLVERKAPFSPSAKTAYPRQRAEYNVTRILSSLRHLDLSEVRMLDVLQNNNYLKEMVDG